MRRLLAVVGLAWLLAVGLHVPGAQAEPLPDGLPACIPRTVWTPYGTGTDWVRGQADAGGITTSYRAWWCPQTSGQWREYIHLSVGRPEWPLNRIDMELSTVFRSADRLAALRDVVNRYSTAPTAIERPSWDGAARAAFAALGAIKPAPVLWVVAPNGIYPNRPMWDATGAKLIAERASVGAACDCAVPLIRGRQTLCRVTGGVGLAACVRN